MVGFIKLHRKINKWEWYKDSYMVHLLIHLLVGAYWEDTCYRGVEYKRGQITTGRKKLSADTGITEQKLRTGLARLERSGEITTKTTSKFTVITICNYEEYQGYDNSDQPASNQQVTSDQPASNQQVTTVKEVKKLKEVKEVKKLKEVKEVKKTIWAVRPSNFPEKEWDDLLTHRRSIRKPLTEIAFSGLIKEFDKSGLSYGECIVEMANRGWTGFKSDWVKDKKRGGKSGYVEATAGKDYTL